VFRTVVRELIGCALLAAGLGVAACTSLTGSSVSSTTVSTYSPTTGIEIDANALFFHEGCGQGPGVVAKYVTIVYVAGGYYDNTAAEGGLLCQELSLTNGIGCENAVDAGADAGATCPAISLNDCFSDAVFVDLGSFTSAATTFDLVVYAFDQATFDANEQTIADVVKNHADVVPDGGFVGCAANPNEGQLDFELRSIANWTASCNAVQQPNVQSLAACGPLVATGN